MLCFAASERLTIGDLTYYHYSKNGATVIRASKYGVVKNLEPLKEVKISGVTYPVLFVGNGGKSTSEPASFGQYLETAILPPSLEEITGYSFKDCTKLKTLYLPDALEYIGPCAFQNCSSLTEIILPAKVNLIGTSYGPAFNGTSSLKLYVSFGTAALNDNVGISPSTDIYIIPGVSVSSKYKEDAKYIFSRTITPMLGGAKLNITMNYDEFILKSVEFGGKKIEKNDKGEYVISSLDTETEYRFIANIEYKGRVYSVPLPFKTLKPSVNISFSKTQTTVTGTAHLPEDESLTPNDIKVEFYNTVCTLDENKRFTVTGLHPATEYRYEIEAKYNGKLYYTKDKIRTYDLTSLLNSDITPTSIKISPTYDVGDAEYVSDKVMLLEKNTYIDLTSNSIAGLEPRTKYTFKHIITIKTGWEYDYPYVHEIWTTPLTLDTQDAVITSTSSVRLKALTNAKDAEGFGFEWRRIDAPDMVPSTKVASPIVNGMLVGSLRNVNPDAYYKYRPYYESASGNIYYGEWIGFFTGDANIYYEPELTTLELRITPDNEYVAEGIVIDGTDDIIEQGFEYATTSRVTALESKSTNEKIRVKATGMHMTSILHGLMSNTSYTLRTYAVTSRGTVYGNEVTFTTGAEAGCEEIVSDEATKTNIVGYYNINGIKKDIPHQGLNIVLYSDGSTRKMFFRNHR